MGLLSLFALAGCVNIPEGVEPVSDFNLDRYLGTWHEIARLENRFERGLIKVTATYSLNPDGSIQVLNKGYDPSSKAWKQAEGRAYPVGAPDIGRLKVSFFGPFYAGYNIIALDPEYQHALVCGNDRSYLWILARTPTLPEATMQRLLNKAHELGFDTKALIYPET